MFDSIKLTNMVNNQAVVIGTVDTDFIIGDVDLGTVEGNHHSYKYVDQVGVHIESTTLEQRAVSIPGWVIGKDYATLKRNKDILNRIVNPQHLLVATVYDKYRLQFKPDFSIRYSVEYAQNNEVLCQFLIQGTCADPMFSTVSSLPTYIASTIPKFHFPWVIPKDKGALLGLREPSLIATIDNEGDIDTGMLIKFSCTSTVVNPSLLNVLTREFVKINKTLSGGDSVTVSTEPGNKFVLGTSKGVTENYFKYRDFDSVWLPMRVGANVLKYDADSGVDSLNVLVTFTPKFLEVQ